MQDQGRALNREQYTKILRVCEYYPHIEICQKNNLDNNQNYCNIQKNVQKIVVSEFSMILVEYFYVMFCCYNKNIFPQLHINFLTYSIKKQKPVLIFEQFLTQKKLEYLMQSSCPYFTLYYQIFKQIVEILEINQDFMMDQENASDGQQEIKSKVQKLIEMQQGDKQCFQEIQKTGFIKKNSVLYKIRNFNLSLLIFKNQQFKDNLSSYSKKQKQYLQHLKLKKVLHKKFTEYRSIQIDLQTNLYRYFQTFKNNPIFVRLLENQTHIQSAQESIKSQNFQNRKLKIKLKIKGINQQCQYFKKQQFKYKHLDCNIEYLTGKHQIVVRMSPQINLQNNNINELIFKWNAMTLSVGLISLQVVQKIQFQKKKKQVLIRISGQITYDQSIIIRTLKLIDLGAAVCFSLQNWVAKTHFDDISKLLVQDGYERVKHYANIAIQINKVIYDIIN